MECQSLVVLLAVLVNLAWTPAEALKGHSVHGLSDPNQVLADRASEMMAMMRAVDVSDRALKTYFENKRSSWQAYKSKIGANPTLYCSDHQGLLSDLEEQKLELNLIVQGLSALQTQLAKIRDILSKDSGEKSGLHCEAEPKPPICAALDKLEEDLKTRKAEKETEQKLVDDEIARVMNYNCNCEYQEWEHASTTMGECNAACGNGKKVQTRQVKWEKRNGGTECNADDATQELECFLKCCPVHCVMEKWSEWSECPPYCGAEVSKRMQRRKRGVETSATCGGDECGPAQEEKECDILQVKNDEIAALEQKLEDKKC